MNQSDRKTRLAQRIFVISLLLLFAIVSVQYSLKALKGKSAILRWETLIEHLGDEDIYKESLYPNPPIMALMLEPLSALIRQSALAGALTWFYLKVGMAVLCMYWVFRLIETPQQPFPPWAKGLTVVLSIRPIIGDLTHGNINIFILFLVIASLRAFSRGRDFLAGLLLALSIACKVTPALFVGYFLWKRGWRVLAGCGVGLALFFVFVPALCIGWQHNLHALESWIEVMILPFVVGGVVTPEHNNQSLPGLIARLLTPAPSFSTYIGDFYVPLRYDNIADIGSSGARWLVKGFMAAFTVLIVWLCRAPIRERRGDRPAGLFEYAQAVRPVPAKTKIEVRQGWRLAAEYSLVLVGMLLFSERTWKHHCVTLLLPFGVLCYGLASVEWPRRQRWLIGGAVGLATLLMTTTSTGIYGENLNRLQDQVQATSMVIGPAGVIAVTQSGIHTDSYAKTAQLYGAFVWAYFVLIGGLTVQLACWRRMANSVALAPEQKQIAA
jgi:alpha-1,2-mannosyltransferase